LAMSKGMRGDSNIGKGDEERLQGAKNRAFLRGERASYEPRQRNWRLKADSTTWADARPSRMAAWRER
jgi:hypothetical protein